MLGEGELSGRRPGMVLRLVLTLITTVLLMEGTLRVYQRVSFGIPLTAWIPRRVPQQFPLSPFLVFGPRVDWRVPNRPPTPYTSFNPQGFRTTDTIGPKRSTEFRIIALGGSTTEDLWNDEGIHWPLVLECRLHQRGRTDVRVLNGAMSAYSSAHTLVRLAFDVVEYAPDMIIVTHNINDLTVNYTAAAAHRIVDPNYLVKYGQPEYTGSITESDVVVSRVWNAFRARLRDLTSPAAAEWGPYDLDVGRSLFERNLTEIAVLGRARGIRVVLATMPVADSDSLFAYTQGGFQAGKAQVGPLPASRERFLADFGVYNATIERVARETGSILVPMHRLMGSDARQFIDLVHYSSAGTRAVGAAMADALFPMLPRQPSQAGLNRDPESCIWERER